MVRATRRVADDVEAEARAQVFEAAGNGERRGGEHPGGVRTFAVLAQRDLVEGAASDANGTLTITVAPTSIPKSYDSVFPYVSAAGDNGRFCKECSFRPWATSAAAPVTVRVIEDATNRSFIATGSGATWTAAVGLANGASATIVATYADGTISRPFAFTRQDQTP